MTQNPTHRLLDEATIHTEAAVVGGMITWPSRLRDCTLETEDFGHWPHRVVWQALRTLEERATVITTLTLEVEIEKAGKLDAIGGIAGIGILALAGAALDAAHDEHVAHVRDSAIRRRVAVLAGELQLAAMSTSITGGELLDRAARVFSGLDARREDNARPIGELLAECFDRVAAVAEAQLAGEHALTGAPTGVAALDDKTGGWQWKVGNMIAARPAMGKSSLGISTADACTAIGYGVHVFSLEDSEETYAKRVLARATGVAAIRLSRAERRPGVAGTCVSVIERYRKRQGWIVDDRGGLSATEIVRSVRRHAEKNGTRVVIVDYLQLLRSPDPKWDDHRAIGHNLATLIDAGKADGMAYVIMSQLNRELEKRDDKRPKMVDLRGSGEIEEKIKICVALYRGSKYGGPIRGVDYDCECPEAVKRCYHAPSDEDFERQAQCLVLKGGNGPTGGVMATWDGPTMNLY